MDDSHVVINILTEVIQNVDLVWRLSQVASRESIEDRFYRWIHNPTLVQVANITSSGLPEELRAVERFARLVIEKISSGETVEGPAMRLTRLETEIAHEHDKVNELQIRAKEDEVFYQHEYQSRMKLIEDLESRLVETRERTAQALRLAKECGETARREWKLKNQKPLEDQRLYHEMLSARLAQIIRDNAALEAQLMKCRDERSNEVALLTIKMEQDISERRAELDKLRTEVKAETDQLKELEKELAAVTIEYDAIMAQRKKEADEAIARRLEERKRERAAIKIQQWWRFYLFRTMRSRRRKRKGKKKSVTKKDPLDVKVSPVRNEKEEEELRDPSEEPPTAPAAPVAVHVSRKSANARKAASSSEPLDPSSLLTSKDSEEIVAQPSTVVQPSTAYSASTKQSSKTSGTKPSGTAIRVSFKKPGAQTEPEPEKKEVVSNSVTRSSQTDNRVPKSKQVYRPAKV